MRRRRLVLAILALPAVLLVIWGISVVRDASPNPPRVIVGEDDPEATLPSPAVPAGATPDPVEVVVARARPIPMKVGEEPLGGGPPGMSIRAYTVDIDVVAAEEQELCAALDAWLAAPGRALRIDTTWTSSHGVQPGLLDALLRRPAQQYRLVLHARLSPSGAR